MDATALHLELRNALSLADELGRHEHALGNDGLVAQLGVARTTLAELERDAGRSHRRQVIPSPASVERLDRCLRVIRDRSEEIPLVLRPRVVLFMDAVERIVFAEQRPATPVPSKSLFGALPLARAVPQDVHSIADFVIAGAYIASAIASRTTRARLVGYAMGAFHGGVAAITDARLSLVKAIPIEAHQLLEHASGAKMCALPFVLRYAKKDPLAAAIQIAAGLGTIALALFTDYRAAKGIGRPRRSKGGPAHRRDRLPKNVHHRVPEVQRPLEGLAGPSYLPHAEV